MTPARTRRKRRRSKVVTIVTRPIFTVDDLITWLAQYPNDSTVVVRFPGRLIVASNGLILGSVRENEATHVVLNHEDVKKAR
jgi:hypothetical protein